MNHDIYQIIESLDAAQKSVKQLPALFKPKETSPVLSGPYGKENATQGYLVGEGQDETNPMAQAVIRRIANAHPEWLVKYGVEAVLQAVDDVTQGETDWEEIGSSDVSAYVDYVQDALRDRMGSREEMDARKPFSEHDGRDDEEEEIDDDGMTMADRARRDGRGGDDDEDEEDEQDVKESLRPGEWHVATVTFDDGTTEKVKITSDEGFRQPIIDRYARQGRTVKDIDVDWGVRGPMEESKDTATEDVISAVKKKLGDYLQDVATAIKKDPDLVDQIPKDVDQIKAVKTIKTDDGHEIKIHGNEDDGFRITVKNKEIKKPFESLDEAVMACEMYCSHRKNKALSADYIEEKHIS